MMGQVFYLMSGAAHLPYLVVSLYSLRQHWQGEVMVYVWPETADFVREICKDRRLACGYWVREPKLRKKDGIGSNSQFLDKIDLTRGWLIGEPEVALYLDADTSVHGPLTPLFGKALKSGFCATQFNDWTTHTSTIRKRLQSLQDIADSHLLNQLLLGLRWPSVNGGVWAARPESPVLSQWYDLTLQACPHFIADEKCLHLMMVKFWPDSLDVLLEHGRYNTSPRFQSQDIADSEVVVYHYHGDSNVRPKKSQKGVDVWWPMFLHCLNDNLGGIADWLPSIKNRHLTNLLAEKKQCVSLG